MARKPFGGYVVSFGKCRADSVTDIFGSGELTPSEMTKKLWAYVKRKGLMKK